MKRALAALLAIFIIIGTVPTVMGDCGDVNDDGTIDILDIVRLINFKYKGGAGPDCGTMTDIDGNVYHTVTIGGQVWMAENLKVVHYRNGDPIPEVTDNTEWIELTTDAYCNYDDDEHNVGTYGRLYNWYAVDDSRNIAPEGWHIPSDAEWQTLVDYLGGDLFAGGKLKEDGTTHWQSPNTGATNESGFTALPAGYRFFYGEFHQMGLETAYWTTTEYSAGSAWIRSIEYDVANAYHTYGVKPFGLSVRCIKD